MYAPWLEVVVPIVEEAGRLARKNSRYGKRAAEKKARGEWVTATDRAVEDLIVDRLKYHFPDHGTLGEEGGLNGDAGQCWVIDPLDGTTNYIHRYPQTVISVAYCHRQKPALAVVYDFYNDELFTATDGDGAYLNKTRLRVSAESSAGDSLFIASGQIGEARLWPLVAAMAQKSEGMRRTGSTVLDLAWLAAGRVEAVISGPVNYWDVAAGSLLVREAGGLICDERDVRTFAFNQRTPCYVAAAPRVFTRFFTEMKSFLQNRPDHAD